MPAYKVFVTALYMRLVSIPCVIEDPDAVTKVGKKFPTVVDLSNTATFVAEAAFPLTEPTVKMFVFGL